MNEISWSETSIRVAGTAMHVKRAGPASDAGPASEKPPLLVLHHDIGTPDRLPFYDGLAADYDVILPHHPGFGQSERPEWARSARDLAVMYQALIAELGLHKPILVGLGFGGWLAAELATMAPRDLSGLVLVGAMGIQPTEGFIFDQAMVDYIQYVRAGFHDLDAYARVFTERPDTDQLEQWDLCREMCFRIAWKPYMYSPSLPHLLASVKVPAAIVWGDKDHIVPQEAGNQYAAALPNAKLTTIPHCGHYVDMERPDELISIIKQLPSAK